MLKMHYFSTNFQKSQSAGSSSPSSILVTWSSVIWPNCVFFKLIITKSNFKNIVMTSLPLSHRKTSPK